MIHNRSLFRASRSRPLVVGLLASAALTLPLKALAEDGDTPPETIVQETSVAPVEALSSPATDAEPPAQADATAAAPTGASAPPVETATEATGETDDTASETASDTVAGATAEAPVADAGTDENAISDTSPQDAAAEADVTDTAEATAEAALDAAREATDAPVSAEASEEATADAGAAETASQDGEVPASPEAQPATAETAPDAAATDTAETNTAPAETNAAETTQAEASEPAVAEPAHDPAALALAIEAGLGKTDNKALVAFYTERDFAPLWLDGGRLGEEARAVIDRLDNAHTDGLDPARYIVPAILGGVSDAAGPDDLAAADLALTAAALRFATDAQAGTMDPASLGELMTAKPVRPKPAAVLDGLASADDKVAYLEGFNPPHPQFRALKTLLAELRDRDDADAPPEVPAGKTLKPGMSDSRVPLLRTRLGLTEPQDGPDAAAEPGQVSDTDSADIVTGSTPDASPASNASLVYDDALVDAVKAFQEAASLDVDGVIGPQTLAALNGGTAVTVGDVLVNMERWRWMPREMGYHNVWVNIPEFRLRVVTGGRTAFTTRVIVGKPQNQTPVFSDEIEYVDVNPFWNVPRSIAAKEMMPVIRRDPDYFVRHGYEVIYTGGGQDIVIDPRTVDWNLWNPENMPFRFRQPPGEANALGRVKFMFPNKHHVYLHDTPSRNLFSRSVRSFSHGCVRVDKPVEFADALLSQEEQINGNRIKHLIGGGENGSLPVKRHIPVHLSYFTVWVDEAGETQKRPDIYHYDERMKAAMGLGS